MSEPSFLSIFLAHLFPRGRCAFEGGKKTGSEGNKAMGWWAMESALRVPLPVSFYGLSQGPRDLLSLGRQLWQATLFIWRTLCSIRQGENWWLRGLFFTLRPEILLPKDKSFLACAHRNSSTEELLARWARLPNNDTYKEIVSILRKKVFMEKGTHIIKWGREVGWRLLKDNLGRKQEKNSVWSSPMDTFKRSEKIIAGNF